MSDGDKRVPPQRAQNFDSNYARGQVQNFSVARHPPNQIPQMYPNQPIQIMYAAPPYMRPPQMTAPQALNSVTQAPVPVTAGYVPQPLNPAVAPPPPWFYVPQQQTARKPEIIGYNGAPPTGNGVGGPPPLAPYYRFMPPAQQIPASMAPKMTVPASLTPSATLRYARPSGPYHQRSSSSVSNSGVVGTVGPQMSPRGVVIAQPMPSPYRANPPSAESRHARNISQSGVDSTVSSSASSVRSFEGSSVGNLEPGRTPPQQPTPVGYNNAFAPSPARPDGAQQPPTYFYPIRAATVVNSNPSAKQFVGNSAGYPMKYDAPVSVITKQVRQGVPFARSHSLYSASKPPSSSNLAVETASVSPQPSGVAITPLSAASNGIHVIKEAQWQTMHQSKALADGVKQLSPLNYVRSLSQDDASPSPILPVASVESIETLFLETISDQLNLARFSAMQNVELGEFADTFDSIKVDKLLQLCLKSTVPFEMLDWESVDLRTLEVRQQREFAKATAAAEALVARKLKKKKRRDKQWGWASFDMNDERNKALDANLKEHGPRGHVMANMYETERNYVRDLDTMRRYFRVKLKNMISKTSLSIIFSGIDDLYEFHKLFLAELEYIVENFSNDTGIGALFLKYKSSFSVYKTFMSSYAACQAQMRYEEKNHSEYRNFMRDCLSNPNTNRQQLRDYMILPVQRTTRYQLLLRDLLKYTPPSHPDYDQLKQALESMQSLAVMVNDVKREEEETTAMFAAFEVTRDCPPTLISAKRRLVLSVDVVELFIYKRPLRLFFFSDLLMMATCVGDGFDDLLLSSDAGAVTDNDTNGSDAGVSPSASHHFQPSYDSNSTHNGLSFGSSLSSSLGTTMLNALSASGSAVGWGKLSGRDSRKNAGSYFGFGSSSSLSESQSGVNGGAVGVGVAGTVVTDVAKLSVIPTASVPEVQSFFMSSLAPAAASGTSAPDDFATNGPQFRFLRWIDYRDLKRHEATDLFYEKCSPARGVFLNGKKADVPLAVRDCLLLSMEYPKYDPSSLTTFLPDQHPLRRQKSSSTKTPASAGQSYTRKLGLGIPQPGGERATFAFRLMGWDASRNKKKLDNLLEGKLESASLPNLESLNMFPASGSTSEACAQSPHQRRVESKLLPSLNTSVPLRGDMLHEDGGSTPRFASPAITRSSTQEQMPLPPVPPIPPVPPLPKNSGGSFSSSSSSSSFAASSFSSSRSSSRHNSPVIPTKNSALPPVPTVSSLSVNYKPLPESPDSLSKNR